MKATIKPRALEKGMTIGVVGPAGIVRKQETLEAGVAKLESLGFRVKLGETCAARYGYLAGDDGLRARDICRMFADPDADMVLCTRGGYGATRILDLIDYDVIKKNPKPFMGYSDITALHAAFLTQAGLATLHGPVLTTFADPKENDDFTIDSFLRVAQGEVVALENPPGYAREALSGGRAEGVLLGGNLQLLTCLCGTKYMPDYTGTLLFIEEVNEDPYSVDRMLTHLRTAGVFERCAGVLLGEFTNCMGKPDEIQMTLDEIYRDILVPCGKPILKGIRCGHCSPTLTLPLGTRCAMDADAGTFVMLEAAVEA